MAGLLAFAAAGAAQGLGQGLAERAKAKREAALAALESEARYAMEEQKHQWRMDEIDAKAANRAPRGGGGGGGGGRRPAGGEAATPDADLRAAVTREMRAAKIGTSDGAVIDEAASRAASYGGDDAAVKRAISELTVDEEVTNPGGTMLSRGLAGATGVGGDPATWKPDATKKTAKGYGEAKPKPADAPPVVRSQPPAAPQAPGAPAVGTVEDGYEYLGGDPADPKSWRKV